MSYGYNLHIVFLQLVSLRGDIYTLLCNTLENHHIIDLIFHHIHMFTLYIPFYRILAMDSNDFKTRPYLICVEGLLLYFDGKI